MSRLFSHKYLYIQPSCTRQKRKLRQRSIKRVLLSITQNLIVIYVGYKLPQIYRSLKQLTILKFLFIQHLEPVYPDPLLQGLSEGCSQSISRVGVSSESLHGEESPSKLICTVVGRIQILEVVGLRTSVSHWLLAGSSLISCHMSLFKVQFSSIKISKTVCLLTKGSHTSFVT